MMPYKTTGLCAEGLYGHQIWQVQCVHGVQDKLNGDLQLT